MLVGLGPERSGSAVAEVLVRHVRLIVIGKGILLVTRQFRIGIGSGVFFFPLHFLCEILFLCLIS